MENTNPARRDHPTHLRGQRQYDNRRGRSSGWFPRQPKAEVTGSADATGGRRGDSEGASDDDVVLSANKQKRTGISYSGSARHGGFGVIGGVLSAVRVFLPLHDDACSFSLV